MNMKRMIAALLALCLLAVCAAGALAEEEPINDLLGFFLRASEGSDMGEGEDVEIEVSPDEYIEVTDLAVTEGLSSNWRNILLLGTDSRTSKKHLRTDTMIVLSLNAETKQIRMASLMRDSWVQLPELGGQKLNAACVYGGPELTMRVINEYFGLNLESYVLVNMECLTSIVDALGGIRLDISGSEARAINKLFDDDRNTHDANARFAGQHVSSGTQVLVNGKQALGYARIRSLDNDYNRTQRQREVLLTIARKLQEQDLLSLAGIVTNMLQYVETNLTFEDIMSIAGICMNANLDEIQELRIPVDETFEAGMFGNTWCIKPDFEANAAALHQFIYGE